MDCVSSGFSLMEGVLVLITERDNWHSFDTSIIGSGQGVVEEGGYEVTGIEAVWARGAWRCKCGW